MLTLLNFTKKEVAKRMRESLTFFYNQDDKVVLCVAWKSPLHAQFQEKVSLIVNYICICFDWFLVRRISLPAAQLFVTAIESILREGVGSLTRLSVIKESTPWKVLDRISRK